MWLIGQHKKHNYSAESRQYWYGSKLSKGNNYDHDDEDEGIEERSDADDVDQGADQGDYGHGVVRDEEKTQEEDEELIKRWLQAC